MIVDTRIGQILRASPSPIPAVGSRVYANTGPQAVLASGAVYLVHQLVTNERFDTLDQQTVGDSLRCWYWQFTIFGPDYTVVRTSIMQLASYLQAYSDRPARGIQAFREISQKLFWADVERLHQGILEMYVDEDLVFP